MKSNFSAICSAIVVSSALLLSPLSMAESAPHHGHHGPHGKMEVAPVAMLLKGPLAKRLVITDEQRSKINTLLENYRATYPRNRKAFKAQHQAMDKIVNAPEFDAQAARALLTKNTERRLAGLKLRHDVNQVLTDEQKAQLQKMRKRRHHRHMGKKPQ